MLEADTEKLDVESAVARAEAEDELARLIADNEFHCSDRNKRFLQFIAEKRFAGQEAAVKAYTIAVDVFGRPSNFDPAIDPIVRIEATRLRSSLERYYESSSHRTKVRISLPAGRYIPEFIRRFVPNDEISETAPSSSMADGKVHPETKGFLKRFQNLARPRLGTIILGFAGGLAVGVLFLTAPQLSQTTDFSSQPAVSIELAVEKQLEPSAVQLRDALIVALERFQTLRIQSESNGNSRYRVSIKYGVDGQNPQIGWQIVDIGQGEILKSGIERVSADNRDWADPNNPLIAKLATRLAGTTGVINSTEASAERPLLGNRCVLQAYHAVEAIDLHSLDISKACLQRTIELYPREADAKAALAVVLIESASAPVPASTREYALDLAEQSAMTDPYSSASAYALMLAKYADGNLDGAIASGQRALALNPYDINIAAWLGRIFALAGRIDEAVPLLVKASKGEGRAAGEAGAILALDAYQQGAYDKAVLQLRESAPKDFIFFQLLEIAALSKAGRSEEVSKAIENMRKLDPDFETQFSKTMASYSAAPSVVSVLEDGLKVAGLKPR